jgi:thioredoxin 1
MKSILICLIAAVSISACNSQKEQAKAPAQEAAKTQEQAKITFIELGSDHCVPCKQMIEVTDKIKAKYKTQLNFQFVDVNKDKDALAKYKIQLIPSQIFMDKSGKEIYRHTGFLPEEKIDSLLQANGLKA